MFGTQIAIRNKLLPGELDYFLSRLFWDVETYADQ